MLFDLDDTIVQAGSFVSPRVLDALRKARRAGYVLAIASGRPLCAVHEALLSPDVMDYAICSNGATVTRLADAASLRRQTMSCEQALGCLHALEPFSPAWNGFFDNKAYFEWKGASYMLTGRTGAVARATRQTPRRGAAVLRLAVRGMRFLHRTLTNKRHRQVLRLRPHLEGARGGIEKIGCTILNAQECAAAAQVLRETGQFEVVAMGSTELEITACGVTKGSGAQWLMDKLHLAAADCVAFGDGGNDLPLSEVVGRFVAMGNADDEVKAAATDVCAPVSEDGVAVWIEKNLLGQGGVSC